MFGSCPQPEVSGPRNEAAACACAAVGAVTPESNCEESLGRELTGLLKEHRLPLG